MSKTTTKLSDLVPARTAGQLPSSRTESLLTDALASDDIDTVKANLMHVWGHYQSLEFFINDVEANIKALNGALNDPDVENDIDPITLAAGFYNTAGIGMAYETAHESGGLGMLLGLTVPESLRLAYSDLDFSDPSETDNIAKAVDLDTDD